MRGVQERFKILILGETNVGKTSIVNRFMGNEVNDISNTIGIDFVSTTVVVSNKLIKMQIWDTAGQERYRSITKAYYRGAQGVFIVFDLSDERSFVMVKKWLEDLNNETEESTPKILVGNKRDKFTPKELSEIENKYKHKSKKYNTKLMFVSAFDGSGIEDLFLEMGKLLISSHKKSKIGKKGVNFKDIARSRCC